MNYAKLAAVFASLIFAGMAAVVFAQDDTDSEASDETVDEASYSRKGADSCLSCHDDDPMVLALFRSKHATPGNAHSPFGNGQLQCEACHGPGGNHAGRVRRGKERPPIMSFASNDPTPATSQNAMCLGCHVEDTGSHWQGGAHDSNDVTCASCHTVHAAKDSMQQPSTQNEKCFTCHTQQRTESRKPFSHPLHQGKMACSSCHSPHGGASESELVESTVNTTCLQCHAEKRGPFLWEHAPVAEDCLSCHAAHGASQPGMLTRRAPLLCQSCHAQAGHPSIALNTEGLANSMPSPLLLGNSCLNCHSQVHGSNHPSGSKLSR